MIRMWGFDSEPNVKNLLRLDRKLRSLKDLFYQPNTSIERNAHQVNPIGLCGGRLAEAIEEIMRQDEDGESYLQNLPLDEVLELIDWASGFDVTAPKKSSVNAAVPTTRRILEFQDRYLTSKTSFHTMPVKERCMFCFFFAWRTLMHAGIFAVDSFDHAMHP